MRFKTALIALAIAAMTVAIAPASWANSLTFQNVTFGLTDNGGGSLTFTIANALNANGDWTGINGIEDFSLKNIGGTTMSLTGWTVNGLELSANGCDGGASGGFCFTHSPPLALTNSMTFNITYTGTLNLTGPTLKVFFTTDCTTGGGTGACDKTGSLLSQVVPPTGVPEPASLLLLGAGLAGIGIWRRKVA